jgi:hypothetical protein
MGRKEGSRKAVYLQLEGLWKKNANASHPPKNHVLTHTHTTHTRIIFTTDTHTQI